MSTILLLCEKPYAAMRIAEALSDQKPERQLKHGMRYYDIPHGEDRLIVCSALGHLYGVAAKAKTKRDSYPVLDYEWKPKHMVERGQKRVQLCIQAISELSKKADQFVNACDYDLEGSLIGYMIMKYACNNVESKARRMKFSTLTRNDLESAYSTLLPNLDFNLVCAGMCRHEIDWLYGINLSRALTVPTSRYGSGYVTLSTGRVQGPTLRFLVEREKEIKSFIPEPYWAIDTILDINGKKIRAEYKSQKLSSIVAANKIVEDCSGKTGVVADLSACKVKLVPPHPFDLSDLQSEAYRIFHILPHESAKIAERLYLDALISYPRTSSHKLPPSIGYNGILSGLARSTYYREKCQELLSSDTLHPFEGEKMDSAHPAIHPTGAIPSANLDDRARKIFDLVVKRFMATFAPAATIANERARIESGDHTFYVRGSKTLEPGWIDFYHTYARLEEAELPSMHVGQGVPFQKITATEKRTRPPLRFNPSSLLQLMEEQGIGTKATRAEIIDTLYKRGYVREERMMATTLAFDVMELMLRYCPKIVDVGFTRELEENMREIELGRTTKEKVVREAVEALKPAIEALRANELEIGNTLSRSALLKVISERTLRSSCPICSSKLYIQKSKTTGKRFIVCSRDQLSECRFTLPLPQAGKLTLLERNCPRCGFQLVRTWIRGRKPLISCARCYVSSKRVFIDVRDRSMKP